MEASFDLWKAEKVYYPSAIRETTSASSEAVSVSQEVEAAQLEAAQLKAAQLEAAQLEAAQFVPTPDEPAEGGEPHGVTETPEGLNLEVPQEAAKSTVSAQVSDAEEPTLLVQPLQTIPLADVSKGLEANPAQPPQEGDVSQGPKANPTQPP